MQITSPLTGDTIGGDVLVEATATPAGGRTISRVEFYCNSAYLGQDSSAPYSLTFDSRCIYEGSRQLKAIAVDSAGAIHTDTEVVTLANNAVPLPQSDDFEAGIGAWASYNPSGNRRWELLRHELKILGFTRTGLANYVHMATAIVIEDID